MKKLPISRQTFKQIIKDNYLYVDKTKDIHRLITSGDYIFLSRPRRFGKSLTVSTLKEIFTGNKELFKDLYIYDKIEWNKYPVIHVDFTLISHSDKKVLKSSLCSFLNKTAKQNNIMLKNKFVGDKFKELIEELSINSKEKIVILIDEYDKPIIDHITDMKKASENREVLREFYSVLKGSDEYIKFVFITGVSKFSKVSIFSGLNNLKDITLYDEFSTIMGITQEELNSYFPLYIKELGEKEELSEEETLEKIKYWYDGYSWDGTKRLYNPYSILNLFDSKKFRNYWFSTGTTTFLIELIKKEKYEITGLENITVSEYVFDSYDIENIGLNSLLFQTGYLTVKRVDKKTGLYTLTCPNSEVKESILNYLLGEMIDKEVSLVKPLYLELKQTFQEEKIDKAIEIIKSIFAKIPYTLHMEAESYYHSLFYIILTLLGVKIDPEVLTDKGRIDGVLEFPDKIYIMEFKYGKGGSKMKSLLNKAIKQIKEKKYYERFTGEDRKVIFLAVGFIEKEINYKVEVLTG